VLIIDNPDAVDLENAIQQMKDTEEMTIKKLVAHDCDGWTPQVLNTRVPSSFSGPVVSAELILSVEMSNVL